MNNNVTNIALAGSGNVAWHLAKALKLQGYVITNIWSREYANALALADRCGSLVSRNLPGIREGADMIIIAVPDKAIKKVASDLGEYEGIVVHVAGSEPMDVLKGLFENYGVFYPLQTFSKETPVNFKEVPFFLESSKPEVLHAIKKVAARLSEKIYEADSAQRLLLHVAAVFASNYSNLMYIAGNELLKRSNLPAEVLHPLILATASKAVTGDPFKMLTGPARRNDTTTIAKHIEALESFPEYAELYRLLANLISKKYH